MRSIICEVDHGFGAEWVDLVVACKSAVVH